MGNHESLLLNAYYNKDNLSKWIQNGGSETLKSFSINSLSEIEPGYLDFFNNLIYYFELEEYLFVHASFNDEIENPLSDKYYMLWKSCNRYNNPLLTTRIIIHGHSPISLKTIEKQINNKSTVINIDGGCVYSVAHLGKLVAYEINSKAISFVQ